MSEETSWAYRPILGPLTPTDIMAIAGASLGPLHMGYYKPFLPLAATGQLLLGRQEEQEKLQREAQERAAVSAVFGPLYRERTGQALPPNLPTSALSPLSTLLKPQPTPKPSVVDGHLVSPTGDVLYSAPPKSDVMSPERLQQEIEKRRATQRTLEEEIALQQARVRPPSMQIKETAEGLVGIAPGTTEAIPITGPGGTPVQPKPEKLTEMQGKAISYGLRAKNAVKTLDTIEASRYMGSWQRTRDQWAESAGIPRGVSVLGVQVPEVKPLRAMGFVSRVGQLYNQAKQEFITAMLRKDSGATITVSELEQAERTYFPALGDSPEVIQQKARAREQVIAGLLAEAGRGATALGAPPNAPPARAAGGAQDTLNPTIPGVGKVLYAGERDGLKVYQDPNTGHQFIQLTNGDWHILKESEKLGGHS